MFYNISNHPVSKWSPEQSSAAKALVGAGEVVDLTFPNVPTAADMAAVELLADSVVGKVAAGEVAMVQGETSLTFAIIRKLLSAGARVVVASTERVSVETVNPDGSVTKTARFEFAGFRQVL